MFRLTEIVGTKEYRKPEWVTHMEQMQEALKGKYTEISKEIFNLKNDDKFMSFKCFKKLITL